MRQNSLESAAKYALGRMEDHERSNRVSLGFDCGMSLLREALGMPLSPIDERNMRSVGCAPAATEQAKQAELARWLDAIAADISSGSCPDNILRHLHKHTGEPIGVGEPCENLREWLASLVNLVEIAKRVYDITPTASEQLSRLQTKFEKEGVANGYTPNPRSKGA